MITQSKNLFRFMLMLTSLLPCLPFAAQAQSAQQYVTLTNSLAAGETKGLFLIGAPSAPNPFVVPTGMFLVLTDFVLSSQNVPPPPGSTWSLQINPQPPALFNTQMPLQSSAAEPSSFQVHMTTGMMFQSGATVTVSMLQGTQPIGFYAYGLLLPQKRRDDRD